MLLALITDTHWGVRSDSSEFYDHFEMFYRDIFFPTLSARRIKKIVHLGDVVDRRKYINYVTLNRFRRMFIEPAMDRGIEIDVIVGNHDAPYKNTNDVNSIHELFASTGMDGIKVFSETTVIDYDGLSVLLVPWINSGNYQKSMDLIADTKAQVLFGHLEISGFEMYRGVVSQDGFDRKIFEKFDVVASGHFHEPSIGSNIRYLGSPYEMSWGDYDGERGFHIFDTETREFEYVQNPHRMFHKIWYDDKEDPEQSLTEEISKAVRNTYVKVIVTNKDNPFLFDKFMTAVYDAGPIDVSIVEDHKNLNSISEESIVTGAVDSRAMLKRYLEASIETDKIPEDLPRLLDELYDEAVAMEHVD